MCPSLCLSTSPVSLCSSFCPFSCSATTPWGLTFIRKAANRTVTARQGGEARVAPWSFGHSWRERSQAHGRAYDHHGRIPRSCCHHGSTRTDDRDTAPGRRQRDETRRDTSGSGLKWLEGGKRASSGCKAGPKHKGAGWNRYKDGSQACQLQAACVQCIWRRITGRGSALQILH